jgi:hypothetical protein
MWMFHQDTKFHIPYGANYRNDTDMKQEYQSKMEYALPLVLAYQCKGEQELIMKNGVFWVVTPCGSCKNRRFGGTWRLLHQGDKN